MGSEGKVLKILDKNTIVVSLGREDVNKGDKLIVYSLGDEITGEKGESLGRIEIVKADVEVAHVQEKFSTAVSPLVTETAFETENAPSLYGQSTYGYSTYSLPSWMKSTSVQRTRTEKYREPLPVEETQVGVDRKIRVGDLVRKG